LFSGIRNKLKMKEVEKRERKIESEGERIEKSEKTS
jgi:hypothetical protein